MAEASNDARRRSGPGLVTRVRRAWIVLVPEQRLAGGCAIGLFITLFLPWYTRNTAVLDRNNTLQHVGQKLNAWQSFSFVEAAILLIAVGVLVLLFARGERKGFHLPGGDGLVILAAGAWTALLVFFRVIDNKSGHSSSVQTVDYGVTWGIFVTLLCGLALAYAGHRLRQAHIAEPPSPAAAPPPPRPAPAPPAAAPPEPGPGIAERRAAREQARAQRERERAATVVSSAPAPAPAPVPPPTSADNEAPTVRRPSGTGEDDERPEDVATRQMRLDDPA